MRKLFLLLSIVPLITVFVGSAFAQGKPDKPDKCEVGGRLPRNWAQFESIYVYFDYVLCPPDLKPARPLVQVWITGEGNSYEVDKLRVDRDGADVISVYRDKNKAFTLYRDLNAVPLSIFHADRRGQVPPEVAGKPFLQEGKLLIAFENLKSESGERVKKAFKGADAVIKAAERKVPLLHESSNIKEVYFALMTSLKSEK
jgi:hypothetical protein